MLVSWTEHYPKRLRIRYHTTRMDFYPNNFQASRGRTIYWSFSSNDRGESIFYGTELKYVYPTASKLQDVSAAGDVVLPYQYEGPSRHLFKRQATGLDVTTLRTIPPMKIDVVPQTLSCNVRFPAWLSARTLPMFTVQDTIEIYKFNRKGCGALPRA